MNLFFQIFILVYLSTHFYVFLKIRSAFPFGLRPGILIAVAFLVLAFSPFLVHFMERQRYESLARATAYIAYCWMGLLFLFFCTSLCVDLYRTGIRLAGFLSAKDLSPFLPSARFSFFFPLILSLTVFVYGYFEALNVRVEKFTIKTPKIPANPGTIRIVQISDMHLGLLLHRERLLRIINLIQAQKPDILVSTGDLVDGQLDDIAPLAGIFRQVRPRYGKYAVTGNHEYFAGITQSLAFTRDSEFTILRGEAREAAKGLRIAGMDDIMEERRSPSTFKSEETFLCSESGNHDFTVLLKHRPAVNQSTRGCVDLQLSGHTHQGQIFPFRLFTWFSYPLDGGMARSSDGFSFYVSRGTGTWGPPIRVLSPPEITVIDLVHE